MVRSTHPTPGPALLACPFCGGSGVLIQRRATDPGRIECDGCGATGPVLHQVGARTPGHAWNCRVEPDAPELP